VAEAVGGCMCMCGSNRMASLPVDDFARDRLWLYEPVPVSPLRALGLGVRGDGWWCWGGQWLYLYMGVRWWKSGMAF